MNHLPLIRKSLCKKNLLHQAELVLASKPSNANSSELNLRLAEKNTKKKKLHQAELYIASKSARSSSALLNSHLARKASHAKRLHLAQIASMIK
tara:strand:+ start:1688 stop:1969 length:282 start_codon:yes stop_codon:yes gene_type:complete